MSRGQRSSALYHHPFRAQSNSYFDILQRIILQHSAHTPAAPDSRRPACGFL